MSEQSQVVAASVIGAVVGALAGYLFFTERGRALRRELEPGLEEAARDLSRVTGTMFGAAGAAREGWKIVRDAIDRIDTHRYPHSNQTSPF
ncbi:MAG: YtxH domain-containing protein [Vicinamibacterales bacterium]